VSAPPTLQQRIEFAEACIELGWAHIQALPASRGGIIEDARYATRRANCMTEIDKWLDQLGVMYLERTGNQGVPDHYAAS
jgi:hypothetical protein